MRFKLVIMFMDVHWMILQLYSSWFEELCMNSISENFVWDAFSWLSCSGSWSTVDLWIWFELHVVVDVSSFILQKEWMNLVKNQERNRDLKWALGAAFFWFYSLLLWGWRWWCVILWLVMALFEILSYSLFYTNLFLDQTNSKNSEKITIGLKCFLIFCGIFS